MRTRIAWLLMLWIGCSRGEGGARPAVDGGALDSGSSDGAADGGAVPCGALRCRADQTCSGGACTFACSGVKVPGDYATVQAAIDAVGAVGGTICLAARAFPEEVMAAPLKDVTVQGVSPDASVVERLRIGPAGGKLTLRGVGVADGVAITQANVALSACRVRTSGGRAAVGVTVQQPGFFAVTVDRCDLQSKPPQDAFSVRDPGHGGWAVSVTSSYLHDSNVGVGVYQSTNVGGAANVSLFNNTLMGNDRGIESARVSGGTGSISLTYTNNLIVGNGVGVQLFAGTAGATHRNNALFGNTTSYGGAAVPGAGYVTADPLLDRAADPPSLSPGSPCRGAGDMAGAPEVDFWGRPRAPGVDIGAVQSP